MPRKCLVINIDRCTGCDSCIVSCKFENHLPLGTFYNRVMQVGPTGTYPNIERYNLPVQCQQCTHARCVEVCPTGASYRDSESGIVLVNEAKCIGCQYCLYACPYGVRPAAPGSTAIWTTRIRLFPGNWPSTTMSAFTRWALPKAKSP